MALSQSQADQLRQALGLDASVPDSDIEELAGTKAGMAMLKKIQGQGQKGILGDIEGFLGSGAQAIEQAGGTKKLEKLFDSLSGAKPAPKKVAAKKGTSDLSESDALDQLAQWLASNYSMQGQLAMAQQGQELAQQNQAVTSTVDKYLGGGGANSGDPAVNAAMQAYQQAYSAGEGLQSAAYANMGAANAQYLAQSPLYPIANLLTQGFGSTQFKELPQSVVKSLPESIQYALAQAGVGETAGNTGIPSYGQPIPPPKGGWPGGTTGGNQSLASILGGLPGGTNPNINPSVYTPGNPNIPGQ